jgi:Nickel/cobalt transporter regulator
MRSLGFTGVAVAALMVSQPALAEIDSAVGAPPMPSAAMPAPPISGSMGNADQRGASAVMEAPMARSGPNRRLDYVRPSYGFQLPRQWMSPEYVVDYREHRLDRPAPGFGWSRYYNDMVLTDQWGRVYDVAGYDDGGYPDGRGHSGRRFGSRATDGVAGGVAGAAVGAVAGNLIAGAGSRLAGSLIGGGVGALAGLAIEAALSKKHKRHDRRGEYDEGQYRRGYGSHWGGGYGGGYGMAYNCNCGGGGETVTTTTTTTHFGGGGGYMVPQRVVYYENVYAPVKTKYRVREAAPTKYRVREEAPVTYGKVRERTKLHTKTY